MLNANVAINVINEDAWINPAAISRQKTRSFSGCVAQTTPRPGESSLLAFIWPVLPERSLFLLKAKQILPPPADLAKNSRMWKRLCSASEGEEGGAIWPHFTGSQRGTEF